MALTIATVDLQVLVLLQVLLQESLNLLLLAAISPMGHSHPPATFELRLLSIITHLRLIQTSYVLNFHKICFYHVTTGKDCHQYHDNNISFQHIHKICMILLFKILSFMI